MMDVLNFQLLGTRGSRPIFDQNFIRFGGNTTAYKVWAQGLFPIYIDGGSGLYREGKRVLGQANQFTFLLTHSHWDHILAFPFFEPFYHASTYARFWGTASFKETFEELFQHQFQTDAFPIHFSELPAKIEFTTVMEKQNFIIPPPLEPVPDMGSSRMTRSYTVRTYQLNHPGYDLGYRIEYAGKSIVIITDTAPIEDNHLGHRMEHYTKADEKRYYQGLVDFCWDADLILYDTHFNERTIKGKESWGHSTEAMAVQLAGEARVKRLILGHHAPEDNDLAILKKLENARKLSESHPLEIIVPEEDDIVEV
jgi:phosphoribosyl 1,2-cyclic phosphodiesterase